MQTILRQRLLCYTLTVAIVVRLCTVAGFAPVWFDDSFEYVGVAQRMQPYPVRPSGYSFLLSALEPLHSFAAVAVVQHAMGLGTGVMVYALLRRRLPRLPQWAAVAASVPVLFDAQQIFFEHAMLSDVFFTFLVTGAITAALWRARLSNRRALLCGLLLAVATLTRSIGLALLILLAAHLLLTRPGWRPALALLVAVALPLGAYATWYGTVHGRPALTGGTGVWLWARTMPFMDCDRLVPPPAEAVLCPRQSVQDRPRSPYFIWSSWSPLRSVPGYRVESRADLFQPGIDALAQRLAFRALIAQPGSYVATVGQDLRQMLIWRRGTDPRRTDIGYNRYAFPNTRQPLPGGDVRIAGATVAVDLRTYEAGQVKVDFLEPFASAMRTYQTYVFIPGPVFAVLLLVASCMTIAAAVNRRWRGAAHVAFLPMAAALTLVIAPVLVTSYDSRYLLPALPLLAMALTASCAAIFSRRSPGRISEPDQTPTLAT
ncbi:hypothetical protein [Streptosporangium sp. CA-115845]|uniref:hypothetical protein n=1 Tax=Streptosporangium sp. CA-115845 TaxID=3240071 RepID=UPI003D90B2C1